MLDLPLIGEVGNWEKVDVSVAAIAADLLMLVLIVTPLTAKAAIKAANEAEKANQRSQDEMVMRLRPSLGIHPPDTRSIIKVKGGIGINIPIRNHGSWPANEVDIRIGGHFDAHTAMATANGFPIRKRNAIYGGEEFPQALDINAENSKAIVDGNPYCIAAIVTYSDSFDRRWRVEASYQFSFDSDDNVYSVEPLHVGIPEQVEA